MRKGERGAVIVFFKELEPEDGSETDSSTDALRLVARASRVFNAMQVDGWTPPDESLPPLWRFQALVTAEAFITKTGAMIRRGYDACYLRSSDTIEMPDPARFTGTPTSSPTESYYGVLLHELTHWTGAEHRLNRDMGKRFGDAGYAMEELVAELGAAFLCADLSITSEPRPDHAAYIDNWLSVLKKDTRAIFVAAGSASRAAEYLLNVAQSRQG